MQAIQVTDTAAEIIPAGNRDFLAIRNVSDTSIYLCFDGDTAALTTSNGFLLKADEILFLSNDGGRNVYNKAISAIHGVAATDKEIRVQGV